MLEQIDVHKTFYLLKYSSLFEYATRGLGLSESVAYIYITVARKSREVPALKAEIRAGTISVSKAKRIAPVLNSENQAHWLELAKSASKHELEKRLSGGSAQISVSEKTMIQIRRAQDVLSQKKRRSVSLDEAMAAMAECYLWKHDPLEIAKRRKSLCPGTVADMPASRKLPASVKHELTLRDEARCTYVNEKGERCTNTRFLEAHHVQHFAQGGKSDLNNLRLLCSGHHKISHVSD